MTPIPNERLKEIRRWLASRPVEDMAENMYRELLDEIEALRKALSLAREGLFIGLQCGQQSRDEYRDVKEAIAAVDAALYAPPPPSRSAPDTETEKGAAK